MTRRIYRYRLPITDAPALQLPAGAAVLSVGTPRDGTDQIDMWALIDVQNLGLEQLREFRVVGTGNPVPDDCGRFIGTIPIRGGRLIFHVFEVVGP